MSRWLAVPVIGGLAWAFPAMADAVLKATCLLAVALIAELVLRRRGAAVRHLLLIATFGLLLALPALTLVLPGWQVLPQWLQLPVERPAVIAETEAPVHELVNSNSAIDWSPREDSFASMAAIGSDENDGPVLKSSVPVSGEELAQTPSASAVEPGIDVADEQPAAASGVLSRESRSVFVLAWLVGMALLLLRLAGSAILLWRAHRRARLVTDGPLHQLFEQLRIDMALHRPVRLFVGDDRAMPMAWGLRQACILLPSGVEAWPAAQQRTVLLHELGHLARRDPLWQLLVELVRAVYWFHPLVWLAAWRVHVERERACDDLVLNRGVAPGDYARHLLDVVSGGRLRTARPAVGVAMASTRKLAGRVRSILDERRNRRPVTRTVAAGGVLACVAIGLPLAMMRAADHDDEPAVQQQSTADAAVDEESDHPPRDAASQLTVEPASPEEMTRRVRELLYVLRQHRVFSRSDYWGGAMRELIEIGRPAVPELVAELDRTDRHETLSALGFVLRGIGDPRAVPALIRNIPKLLQAPRSDYGIYIRDPELRAFLKQYERYENQDKYVSYGRPVNEILDALQKLTGHNEPADPKNDPLRHVMLGGGPAQRAAAREQFSERQAHWEQWWSQHRHEFVTDEALQSLELPPHEGDAVAEAGLARFGPTFPTGPDVRLGPVQEIELDSYNYWDAPSHFDFDTGRVFQYLEGAERLEPDTPGDMFSVIVNWPSEMGIDVRMNEGEDLHIWQVDNERWDTIEDEVHRNEPLPLGPEATDWLVRFDGERADFKYEQIGTFLITTREGGRGIVQSHPRDVLTGTVKLRYRMWIDEQHPEPQPPHARPRDTTGPKFGKTVTLTLQTPGRGKPFLLDLEAGKTVTPPDSVVPADAGAQFWFGDSEELVDWCRGNGIDLAARLSLVESETGGDSTQVSLVGLNMSWRNLLPDAFDTMTVPAAWEILHRYPETPEYTWMGPNADIGHQPDTFVIRTRTGRMALLRIWETAEDGSSITIHYRLGPDPQDRTGSDTGGVIRGQVLDSSRRPIADAGVWLPIDLLRDDRTVHATTDAEGRFELTVPAAWRKAARFPGDTIWAWHKDHRLEMASAWPQLQRYTDEVNITLDRPTEETVFDVFSSDGTPASDAQVTPLDVKSPGGDYHPVPVGLREKLQRSADSQGRVRFRTVPPELLNSVQIAADGFGTQVLHLGLEGYEKRDRRIVLGAAGRIEGRIETDDPALLEGLTLYFETRDPGWLDPFWTSSDEDEIERRLNDGDHPRRTRGTAVVRVGADGRFSVPTIAEGRLVMNSSLDETAAHAVRLRDVVVDVEAGRTQQVAINVAPRVTVRGSVVRQGTGEPVPDAIVSVNDGEDRGEQVVTDEKGQFTCDVLAGRVNVVVDFIRNGPDGWKQISASRVVVAPADNDRPVTLPDVVIGQHSTVSTAVSGEKGSAGADRNDDPAFAAVVNLHLVFFEGRARRDVGAVMVDAGNETLVVTSGPACLTPDGVPAAIDRAFVKPAGDQSLPATYHPDSTSEVFVYRAAGGLTTQKLTEWATPAVGDALTVVIRDGRGKLLVQPNAAKVIAVGARRAADLRPDLHRDYENLIKLDQRFPEGTPFFKDGKLAGITLLGTRFARDEGNVSYLVPAERVAELCRRIRSEIAEAGPEDEQTTGGEIFGSLSIDYDVIGGPEEATFMLNLSKRATPVPDAEIVERDVRVANGQSKVVEKLIPGTYQLARIKPIRFVDFTVHFWLDYREVVIEPGHRTEARFARGEGRPVRGRVLGLRERVGDFRQDGSQGGAGVGETLACVLVRGPDAPDPELVRRPPWHRTFDVAPCRQNGEFETEPLEPGTYTLYAHAYRRLTGEERSDTGGILPSWSGSAKVTVPEEGEPEFVEITLQPFETEPVIRMNLDYGPDVDGAESQSPDSTSQTAPAEPPVSIAGEADLRELVAALLPNHRLRLDDEGAPIALAAPGSGELKIPAGGQVEAGPIGYWISPAMTFLSDARPRVSDGAAAAQLIRLLHALCEGPQYVRSKIYRPRQINGGWVIQVDHDFEKDPGMIPAVHPYEILVDEDHRVTSLRQRSQFYPGSADVYADTITAVYEREVRVNRGINYPEVLDEELKQAWAQERGVPLEHNSIAHYPNAVITVTDDDTGERFYVESNGAKVFALNGDGATVRITDVVRAVDLEHLVGAPVVRHLELRGSKLLATVGKHTVVTIDRESGAIESVVSD